jgi:hypothetical protein
MNRLVGGACLLALLALAPMAAPLSANTSSTVPKRTVVAPRYDEAKEVTLGGIIESVVRKPSAGMLPGEHLTVSTQQGTVDAQIGDWVLRGPHPATLSAGESVKLVGVMSTVNGRSVMLTRLIQAGNQTITVRSEHGMVLRPGAAERLARFPMMRGAQ